MEKAIEVRDLRFGYTNDLILNGISFDILKGDFVGMIGTNGTGKSTLIKILLNRLNFSGAVKVFGKDIKKFDEWDKIGYVSQKANLFNHEFPATVKEVVASNLYSRVGLGKRVSKKYDDNIMDALKKVGMEKFSGKLIGNLSGGQQQRVFIARVLVCEPKMLLLDEPTVGIDAKSEWDVFCLLKELNNRFGITVFMITHDLGAVASHANRILGLTENGLVESNLKGKHMGEFFKQVYGYDISEHAHV